MSNDKSKFFHDGVTNQITASGVKAGAYTDECIDAVYKDLKETAGLLDRQFKDIDDRLKGLDEVFGSEIIEVNTYLKETRDAVKHNRIAQGIHAAASVGLLVALLLLSGCSTGIKTVFNGGYPSAVVDRNSQQQCKRVISTIEVHRRVDTFGSPCQVNLVYE